MKHIGFLLVLILTCNFIDLVHPEKSALHGTGYEGKYQKLVPTGAAFIIFAFAELLYLIYYVFWELL